MNSTLVLMTRFPEAGKAKTRLIPHYGADGACALHKQMTEFTVKEAMNLDVCVQVHYTGASFEAMQNWLGKFANSEQDCQSKLEFIPQVNGDLGDKMYTSIANVLNKHNNTSTHKPKKIIIIGSDCPNNRCENIKHAYNLLDNHSCVIGPSEDGGYYLIGFAASNAADFINKIKPLFYNITWGTDLVFAQTLAKIKQAKLYYAVLPMLSDVDLPHDVPQKISVIIPTLNDEESLNNLLYYLPSAFNTQVIISDASNTSKTKEIANNYHTIYVKSAPGRSKQILSAKASATGDIILFLHADSTMPPLWDVKIRAALSNKENSLGYFRFGIKENFWTKRIIEWATNNIRCKIFKLPFGDQGLFVRKDDFLQWNLPEVPILEDVFLVKKAKKHGKLVEIPQTLYTSGRRWLKHGLIRTTIINWSVLTCAKFGMSLNNIKQDYMQGKNPVWNFIKKQK